MEEDTFHSDPFQANSGTRKGLIRSLTPRHHPSPRGSFHILQSLFHEWTRRLEPFLFVSLVPVLLGIPSLAGVFSQTLWKNVGPDGTIVTGIMIGEGSSSNKLLGQTHERTIYALTPTGVYVSSDFEKWRSIPAPSPAEKPEWFVTRTRAGISIVCVGTEGMYRFSPKEWRWQFLGAGFGAKRTVIALDVPWANPQVMYAITTNDDALRDDELMKTIDDGGTWHAIQTVSHGSDLASLLDIRIDPHDHETIYVTAEAGGIVRLTKSTNGGTGWKWLDPERNLGDCLGVTFDPNNRQHAYLLSRTKTGTALYKTIDAFRSFSCKAFIERALQVALHPSDGNHLYVLALPHRLAESTDGGEHWNEVQVSFPTSLVPLSIAVASDGTIYLGTAGKGIVALSRKDKKLSVLGIPSKPLESWAHGYH